MTIPAKLTDTTQADLERLIADLVQEGPHIDFKSDLPAAWDNSAKSEFLADVSAFANAGGGDVIYGVAEDGTAVATAVVPQVPANIDQEVLRMQDFLLHLVEPRMPGIQVFAVPVSVGGASGHAIVIRVPQSWAGPHRVKLGQHFYIREGQRKRQLDVPELRGLFVRSESQAQRVRDFRTERVGKILSGDVPHKLIDGPLMVAHIVPVQSALGLVQIDPVGYSTQRYVPVLGASPGWARMNIDGALAVRGSNVEGTHGYSLLFRNGFLEATKAYPRRGDEQRVNFPSLAYEEQLIALLRAFRVELKHHQIEPSCTVMLSILQANQLKLGVRDTYGFLDKHQTLFDRHTLVIPDVLAPADIAPEVALRPMFDMVWQAAGLERSRNYNAEGVWAPPA
jgi:hypothetical protein